MILRKCVMCGLECLETSELELFVKRKNALHGRKNKCKECAKKEYREKWSKKYEEKRIRPEGYKEYRALKQKYWHLKCKFNMKEDDIKMHLENANYSCQICGRKEEDVYKLVFDHDHDTGLFRGILCHSCNSNLGYFEKGFKNMDKNKTTTSSTFNVDIAYKYVTNKH